MIPESNPTVGTQWTLKSKDGTNNYNATVVATGPQGISLEADAFEGPVLMTPEDWQSRMKAQILTRRQRRRQQRANLPVIRMGGSRIRWFTIGAITCLIGKPFVPALMAYVAELSAWVLKQ